MIAARITPNPITPKNICSLPSKVLYEIDTCPSGTQLETHHSFYIEDDENGPRISMIHPEVKNEYKKDTATLAGMLEMNEGFNRL